jgi:hypothetical protein
MCRFISFLYRPDNGDITIYDLTSHSNTQHKLGLVEPLWCEGHYFPSGEIECRVNDKNRATKEACEERVKSRFPAFFDFFFWAISQEGIVSEDGFDLSGLTTIPAGTVFPKEFGSLDLSGLTTIPAGTVFPKECDSLYLKGLTTIPAGTVFPKECGSLYLKGLTTIPAGTVFPEKITCSLDLSGLTTIPAGTVFPKECGFLDLSADLKKKSMI